MAKAQIKLPDGFSVNVEGTPEEIASLLERLKVAPAPEARPAAKGKKQELTHQGKRQKVQLVDLVGNLIDGGFFKKPKDLASVRAALQEMGHHYPVTTLSGTMLDQVRKRNLRRLKQEKRWMYTG